MHHNSVKGGDVKEKLLVHGHPLFIFNESAQAHICEYTVIVMLSKQAKRKKNKMKN